MKTIMALAEITPFMKMGFISNGQKVFGEVCGNQFIAYMHTPDIIKIFKKEFTLFETEASIFFKGYLLEDKDGEEFSFKGWDDLPNDVRKSTFFQFISSEDSYFYKNLYGFAQVIRINPTTENLLGFGDPMDEISIRYWTNNRIVQEIVDKMNGKEIKE